MSGRAGRRGKDDRGIVIQMMDEKMEPDVLKGILYGDPDPLNSSYRISYNMLLNMMRVGAEEVDPEFLLRASFYQFQQESKVPELESEADNLEKEAQQIVLPEEQEDLDMLVEYYQMQQQLVLTNQNLKQIVFQEAYVRPYINEGRLVRVVHKEEDYGWGVVTSKLKQKQGTAGAGQSAKMARDATSDLHTFNVLLPCTARDSSKTDDKDGNKSDAEAKQTHWGNFLHARPPSSSSTTETYHRVFSISPSSIHLISAVKIFLPSSLTTHDARTNCGKMLSETMRRFKSQGGVPIIDPIKDMGVDNSTRFQQLVRRASALVSRISSHPLLERISDPAPQLALYARKQFLLDQARALRKSARALLSTVMTAQLAQMKTCLNKLGHLSTSSDSSRIGATLDNKGRTACEINAGDELLATELLFGGLFQDLSTEQSVSLLSCLVYEENTKDGDDPLKHLKPYLGQPFKAMRGHVRTIARVKKACKLLPDDDEDKYVDKFHPGMMEAVYAWCKGSKFSQIQKLLPEGTFEGSTIRTLRRLDELVRQMSSAAKVLGNEELSEMFTKGSELLKRDIVFCTSLYL